MKWVFSNKANQQTTGSNCIVKVSTPTNHRRHQIRPLTPQTNKGGAQLRPIVLKNSGSDGVGESIVGVVVVDVAV